MSSFRNIYKSYAYDSMKDTDLLIQIYHKLLEKLSSVKSDAIRASLLSDIQDIFAALFYSLNDSDRDEDDNKDLREAYRSLYAFLYKSIGELANASADNGMLGEQIDSIQEIIKKMIESTKGMSTT